MSCCIFRGFLWRQIFHLLLWNGLSDSLCFCYFSGLPPGSKPPPLTMLSPAGSKIARTTATVPPLSQTSPTPAGANSAMNATRASSFAAALRKLAKQAGDPPGRQFSIDGNKDKLMWFVRFTRLQCFIPKYDLRMIPPRGFFLSAHSPPVVHIISKQRVEYYLH